jgi:hypothetical protein
VPDRTPRKHRRLWVSLALVVLFVFVVTVIFHPRPWRRQPLTGPSAKAATMNEVATLLAGHMVRVSCEAPLTVRLPSGTTSKESGVTNYVGGDRVFLDQTICMDLGHFPYLTADEIGCAERDPGGLCPGTVNQVLRAMSVLAHESFHAQGVSDEAEAECRAMQSVGVVAEQFGASHDEALRLLRYWGDHWRKIEWGLPSRYYSKECRRGGKFDLWPETPEWPG